MNHRLGALLLVLVLVLPVAATVAHADTSTTLVYVSNSVTLDLFGNVAIDTSVTVINNGTATTAPLTVSLTYGGVLTPYVVSQTSNFNVTDTVTGASTTTYSFNISTLTAGNSTQLTFDLLLNGTVQKTGPSTRSYTMTTIPVTDVPGASLVNATAFLTLPSGSNATTDLTQYNFTQEFANPPSYTLGFFNNTTPVSSSVTVTYSQPDVLYRVDNTVSIDQFGWTNTDAVVTVNNTGSAATGDLPVNMNILRELPHLHVEPELEQCFYDRHDH